MMHKTLLRLLYLTAGLTACGANAQFPGTQQPQMPWGMLPGFNANVPNSPEWVPLAKQGLALRKTGKLEESAPIFNSAMVRLKVQEASSDPRVIQYGLTRMDMLMGYRDVLNRLNRPNEALPILQQAAAIEKDDLDKRAKSPTPSMSYLDAMAAMQSTFSTAMNMGRQMNSNLIRVHNDGTYTAQLTSLIPVRAVPGTSTKFVRCPVLESRVHFECNCPPVF